MLSIVLPYEPSRPPLDIPMRNANRRSYQNFSVNVQSGIIHNCQKMEKIQISVNRWMNKWNVAHLYNGIVFHNRRQGSTDTCYEAEGPNNIVLSEWSWSQKTIYCVIPFIGNLQNRQTYTDGNILIFSWCWKGEVGKKWEGSANVDRVSFGDGLCFPSNCGDGCTTLY